MPEPSQSKDDHAAKSQHGGHSDLLEVTPSTPVKLSEFAAEVYQRNAEKSSLLRLPPEIRYMIYEYVLGGQTIHVDKISCWGERTPTLVRSLCVNVLDDQTVAQRIIAQHPTYSRSVCDPAWHPRCNPPATRVPCQGLGRILKFFLTCRQIHEEASLVPYRQNNFYFRNIDDVDCLIDELKPAQASAIRQITIMHFSDYMSTIDRNIEALLQNKLRGVQSMILFLESWVFEWTLSGDGMWPSPGEDVANMRLSVQERWPNLKFTVAAYEREL